MKASNFRFLGAFQATQGQDPAHSYRVCLRFSQEGGTPGKRLSLSSGPYMAPITYTQQAVMSAMMTPVGIRMRPCEQAKARGHPGERNRTLHLDSTRNRSVFGGPRYGKGSRAFSSDTDPGDPRADGCRSPH
jgi:hypothetical protein